MKSALSRPNFNGTIVGARSVFAPCDAKPPPSKVSHNQGKLGLVVMMVMVTVGIRFWLLLNFRNESFCRQQQTSNT